MKRTLLLLAFMAACMAGKAQVDTLFVGDRNPVYYYWDTNWWDHYYNMNFDGYEEWYQSSCHNNDGCMPEFARYCYVDTSLRVIGIAAAVHVAIRKTDSATIEGGAYYPGDDYFFDRMVPEYVRLYEVDSLGDEMHLMAQSEWTVKQTPKYYIQSAWDPNSPYPQSQRQFRKLYEMYFDSVVTVYDSFYVSMTENNLRIPANFHYMFGAPTDGFAYATLCTTYPYQWMDPIVWPKPNHYKRKLHWFDSQNYDDRYEITDTNWHTLHTTSNSGIDPVTQSVPPWTHYMYLFPIIDTSTGLACQLSHDLMLAYQSEDTATLAWEGGYNAQLWELSLCPDSCAPDDGSITQWSTRIATVTGLERGTWYTAWVRSVCDSASVSEWSDSLRFFVPEDADDPEDPIGIEGTVDFYTYLMPNPASGSVTVASSFSIGEVELFSLDGRRLLRKRVDGLSATLDISTLPAGIYIVRIATGAGTTYKKLIAR
ncbi:MAG: T9SS type A sorting domain-containing protein [Bacteroidales bacterium]|nr:T9SS type A sorting domain-containing protein [Bacteroidales bacterium]